MVLATLAGRPACAQPAPDPPVVQQVEVEGSSVFDTGQVERIVRLRPGERLHRDPATLAAHLEHRYHTSGYMAARVGGSFDADTGTLTLRVDEGRLSEVVLEGVEGAAERRARRELALEPGSVLREQEVWDAIDRLEAASRGAVAVRPEEPYTVDGSGAGGARLELHLRTDRSRWTLAPFGLRTAGLYNRVDGLNPGARASLTLTDPSSYDDLDLYAQASIGVASGKARHAAGARRTFGSGRLTTGYEHHDLTDTDDSFRGAPVHGTHTTALYFSSFQDYFRRRGHEAYAFLRIAPGAQLGLTWRGDDYESLPLETDGDPLFSRTPRPNPEVDEGRMRSLIGTLRWTSSGGLFGDVGSERESFLLRSLYGTSFAGEGLKAEATYEWSSDALHSAFDFRRLVVHARGQTLLPRGRGVLRVLVGLTDGAPPLQKRLALGGRGTLRGYDIKEFPGENLAAASLEWEAVAPVFPMPALVLFYDGGTTWGGTDTSDGWKSGAGVGFEWGFGGASILRIDVASRLGPAGGRDRVTVLARLRMPF